MLLWCLIDSIALKINAIPINASWNLSWLSWPYGPWFDACGDEAHRYLVDLMSVSEASSGWITATMLVILSLDNF